MYKHFFHFFLITVLVYGIRAQESAHYGAPKYVPEDGMKLLILGQDLGAVGGLNSHADGYVDNLSQVPGGITTYTSIPSLSGLLNYANWGSGDVNAQAYLDDSDFDNSCIAIGLYINGELQNIRDGFWNNKIRTLANWVKDANRPVFLRIGYEFDGPWNGLDPQDYIVAWQHIVHIFDRDEVRNVAYVWQSAGINTSNIERWYPGDAYVNWVGYSHFDGQNIGQSILRFAEEHDKPIMIAEATPRGRDLENAVGQSVWDQWFDPLFTSIDNNPRIKALAYINADWDSQPMWSGQGWGDTRIQVNSFVQEQWLNEINNDNWLISSEDLFEQLQFEYWQDFVLSTEKELKYSIYVNNQRINLLFPSIPSLGFVSIYDLNGKQLFAKEITDTEIAFETSGVQQQLLVARIQMDEQVVTKKIYVK